jgi:hypothetical protein
VVVVSDFCQTLVRYYTSGLFKSCSAIEVTGLQTRFDPPDPGFEASVLQNYQTVGPVTLLSEAVESSKYDEIDVALQPAATSFNKDATDYAGGEVVLHETGMTASIWKKSPSPEQRSQNGAFARNL